MRRNSFALILILSMLPMGAETVTSDHFRVRSTAVLVEICSTPANDPMYAAAIALPWFCGRRISVLPRLRVWTRG